MVWLRHSCAPLSNGMLLTSCSLCTCSVWRRQDQFSHTLKSVNWMEKQSKKLEMDKQTLRTHFRSENKLFCHSTEMIYPFFIGIPFSMSIFVSCIIYASNHWISFSLIGSMKLFMMLMRLWHSSHVYLNLNKPHEFWCFSLKLRPFLAFLARSNDNMESIVLYVNFKCDYTFDRAEYKIICNQIQLSCWHSIVNHDVHVYVHLIHWHSPFCITFQLNWILIFADSLR